MAMRIGKARGLETTAAVSNVSKLSYQKENDSREEMQRTLLFVIAAFALLIAFLGAEFAFDEMIFRVIPMLFVAITIIWFIYFCVLGILKIVECG